MYVIDPSFAAATLPPSWSLGKSSKTSDSSDGDITSTDKNCSSIMTGGSGQSNGGVVETLKRVWGVGSPKGFRLGAWAVAFAGFGAMWYFENRPTITVNVQPKKAAPETPSS
jgi:hypothetical protein